MSISPFYLKKLTEEDEVQSFDCGADEWERDVSGFLKENALVEQEKGLNVTWLCYSGSQLAGFFALSASSVKIQGRPLKRLFGLKTVSYSSMPCVLIGRFAVCSSMHRQGIGRFMLSWIYGAALKSVFGIKFLTLHVNNQNSIGCAFWESQGFIKLDSESGDTLTYMLYDLYPRSPKG